MGLQTYKCQCGQEFEDSEFVLCQECEDCRVAVPTSPFVNPAIEAAMNSLQRAAQAYSTQRWRLYEPFQYYGPIVGDTITVSMPTATANSGFAVFETNYQSPDEQGQ